MLSRDCNPFARAFRSASTASFRDLRTSEAATCSLFSPAGISTAGSFGTENVTGASMIAKEPMQLRIALPKLITCPGSTTLTPVLKV